MDLFATMLDPSGVPVSKLSQQVAHLDSGRLMENKSATLRFLCEGTLGLRLASAAEDTLKARAKEEGYDLRVLHIKKLANDMMESGLFWIPNPKEGTVHVTDNAMDTSEVQQFVEASGLLPISFDGPPRTACMYFLRLAKGLRISRRLLRRSLMAGLRMSTVKL